MLILTYISEDIGLALHYCEFNLWMNNTQNIWRWR
jgi:hypothetical protein